MQVNKLFQELVRALIKHPGSSARQRVKRIKDRGLKVTKTEVNRLLYSCNIFWSIGNSPPRWQLISGTQAAIVPQQKTASPGSPYPFDLYAWQEAALTAWRDKNRKGVVEAITGSGKTLIGIAAALEELIDGGKVQILVPSTVLLNQWAARVEEYLPQYELGRLGDGHHDNLADVDILVAVVNSARDAVIDIDGQHALLVADECHRYASGSNANALDEETFDSRLGLSATYERPDDGHLTILDPFFGGICYELDYAEAIAHEVTAHFKVALVGVRFNDTEQAVYEEADDKARSHRSWLINNAGVTAEPFGKYMAEVQALSDGGEGESTVRARAYLSAFSRRRKVLANPIAKQVLIDFLVPAAHAAERVLVFTEQVEPAEDAAETLIVNGLKAAAIHSKLPKESSRALLEGFANGSLDVLCAPKVLDEGLDLPAADLGIILAASQSRRQMIQRMGRVLRRKPDGRFARFVIAYVIGTFRGSS